MPISDRNPQNPKPRKINPIFANQAGGETTGRMAGAFRARLNDCLEKTEDGRFKMTITLPDESFLDTMAHSLAQMVGAGVK